MFKRLKKFFSNFYNIYLSGLTLLISLPLLAPILLHLGFTQIAKVIYFIYSFFCHQFAYRSIHLYDYQFAWCARDTGIWIGIWLAAILIKLNKVKGIKWYWVVPFVIPIALDGGIQTIFTVLNVSSTGALTGLPLYMSNNLVRFMTGAIFGIGLSLWLSPMVLSDSVIESRKLQTENEKVPESKNRNSKFNLSNKFKVILMVLAMIPIYVGLFVLWNSTSIVNKPLQPLDAVVKAPQEDFLTRREDAVCPTNGFQDLFAFDCFLGR